MSDISERLYATINEKEYSYGELSKLTGIPKSAIQRYATGETEKIPIDRLESLASALNVSTAYLMGWEEPAPIPGDFIQLFDADPELERQHAEINEIFDRMPPELRAHALALLKGLVPPAQSPDDHTESD